MPLSLLAPGALPPSFSFFAARGSRTRTPSSLLCGQQHWSWTFLFLRLWRKTKRCSMWHCALPNGRINMARRLSKADKMPQRQSWGCDSAWHVCTGCLYSLYVNIWSTGIFTGWISVRESFSFGVFLGQYALPWQPSVPGHAEPLATDEHLLIIDNNSFPGWTQEAEGGHVSTRDAD